MPDPKDPTDDTIIRRHRSRFVRFSGVGAVNTVVDFSAYAVLVYLGVMPALANAGAFFVANSGSYFLNAHVTFHENGRPAPRTLRGYFKFFSAHALSLILSTVLVSVLAGRIGPLWAKGVAIALTVLINYTLTALFVFKSADR